MQIPCECAHSEVCFNINLWQSLPQNSWRVFVTPRLYFSDIFHSKGVLVARNKGHFCQNSWQFAPQWHVSIHDISISFWATAIYLNPPNFEGKIGNLWKCWNWSSIMPPLGVSQEDAHICATRTVSHIKHFLVTWHWLRAGLNLGSSWPQGVPLYNVIPPKPINYFCSWWVKCP